MQHTLKQPFTLRSKGLHTGLELTATFLPAPANSGLRLQRVDLDGQPNIPCLAENVVDTSRGTVVAISPEVRVSTIEHAMAADVDHSGEALPDDLLSDLPNHVIECLDPEWDKYEQSTLKRLAETIRIGIRGDNVDMTVTKRFA